MTLGQAARGAQGAARAPAARSATSATAAGADGDDDRPRQRDVHGEVEAEHGRGGERRPREPAARRRLAGRLGRPDPAQRRQQHQRRRDDQHGDAEEHPAPRRRAARPRRRAAGPTSDGSTQAAENHANTRGCSSAG